MCGRGASDGRRNNDSARVGRILDSLAAVCTLDAVLRRELMAGDSVALRSRFVVAFIRFFPICRASRQGGIGGSSAFACGTANLVIHILRLPLGDLDVLESPADVISGSRNGAVCGGRSHLANFIVAATGRVRVGGW